MKITINKFLTIFILIPSFFIATIYASFSSELMINGIAHLRIPTDIRISNIKVIEQTNGAYETYSSEYNKDSTSIYATLPNVNSTITYEVTIKNNSTISYDLSKIIIDTNSNENISYEMNIEIGEEIPNNNEKTFTIKLFYNKDTLPNDITDTLVIRYEFIEHINSYVVAEYDYSGSPQTFTAPYTGVYKLEVWGAQGGTAKGNKVDQSISEFRGGYGGYSVGNINLNEYSKLYVVVGSQGESGTPELIRNGGYNGGGKVLTYEGDTNITINNRYVSGGGGATHIAKVDGLLSTLSNKIDSIIIVAGGGGGGYLHSQIGYEAIGGDAGGYIGNAGTNGTSGGHYGTGANQLTGGLTYNTIKYGLGTFGQGGNVNTMAHGSAGGGGFYGGGASAGFNSNDETYPSNSSGGGGSGYIGNKLLFNKKMYCYHCQISDEESIKTISTSNNSFQATSTYAKEGNGYAKITFIERIY